MKKIYLLGLFAGLFYSNTNSAQCSGDRYKLQVFMGHSITSDIVYGNNIDYNGSAQDLLLDVYEPEGDAETDRPLIIIAHGGNFLGGSKSGSDVAPLSIDFAKMGYVVASIDYRVGFEGLFAGTMDSVEATETVLRSVHDFRAAIRFFKKDFSENGNTYGIDTSKIILSGVSAGAISAVHTAYLDELSEIPSYVDTTKIGLGGGVEGNSGNPNYSSRGAIGVINIAGALRDTSWMTNTSAPLLSLHGDADATVPYDTDIIYLLGQYEILEVDGSGSMDIRADNVGLTNCLYTYPGADHTPHVNNALYTDTTESLMRNFLVHLICNETMICAYSGGIVGVEEIATTNDLLIYPNPSNGNIQITTNSIITEISLFNVVGKRVWIESKVNGKKKTINLSELPKGVYLAKIKSTKGETTKKIILE